MITDHDGRLPADVTTDWEQRELPAEDFAHLLGTLFATEPEAEQ